MEAHKKGGEVGDRVCQYGDSHGVTSRQQYTRVKQRVFGESESGSPVPETVLDSVRLHLPFCWCSHYLAVTISQKSPLLGVKRPLRNLTWYM